ncbi:pyridoxal phosphate-dependent decarboxylase family protein [Fluviispira multicolorata]|uniref:Aspartate aminotransferase family protein n=1 Tax=Fluviispira multicolorata TaxID=2654512 RepID=A0A833N3V9_9BACT|nr:pyridoxal-dependent decarboxylase [Fluviispira multicolorata]KAB8029212.1 aspartate aminotransferase family protein [Fluviispira multicolorata]
MKNDFNESIKIVSDWITTYRKDIEKYSVLSDVQFGDILKKLPEIAEEQAEPFQNIWEDFNSIIMPGITHWQHPKFFGYFPSNSSPPSILAEMIVASLGVQGMSWITSPSATELEIRVMEWLRNLLGFSNQFSGVIQDSASSSTLIAMIVAREKITDFISNKKGLSNEKLVAYCSSEAHSSLDKAAKIIGIGSDNLRKISVNENQEMNIEELIHTIEEDLKKGMKPFFLNGTFGTTGSNAIDPLNKISQISKKYGLWFHVDAAYAGSALILPELRHLANGINEADSIVVNPHKWLFTTFDCSAFFIRNKDALINTFSILPEYLKTNDTKEVINYRDWGMGLGRRFRSLKLWFVIRWYGKQGLQNLIRSHIDMGKKFESFVKNDDRFEVVAQRHFNHVCFRLKGSNEENTKLLNKINKSGKMFLTHTKLNGKIVLRIVLAQTSLKEEHVIESWNEILDML